MRNVHRIGRIALILSLLVSNCQASCPSGFTTYSGRCYKYDPASVLTREGARNSCANIGGWLATLDTAAIAHGVASALGISSDTYFGLYKEVPCESVGCDGKYLWDTSAGRAASTTGYTANMASYVIIYHNHEK